MWLIERRLSDADGRGAAVVEGAPTPTEPDPDGDLTYDLQVDPAENWYPFRQVAGTGFEAAGFAAADGTVRNPKGVLGQSIATLPFGRIPTEGVGLTRRWRMCRDGDGTPRRWIARTDGAAQETAPSGLAYDVLHLPGRRG